MVLTVMISPHMPHMGFPGNTSGKGPARQCRMRVPMGSIPVSRSSGESGLTTHSGILAQRLPWTEEPGSWAVAVSHRAEHDRSHLAHMPYIFLENVRQELALYPTPALKLPPLKERSVLLTETLLSSYFIFENLGITWEAQTRNDLSQC